MTNATATAKPAAPRSAGNRPAPHKTREMKPQTETVVIETPETIIRDLEGKLDQILAEADENKETDPEAARRAILAVATMRRLGRLKEQLESDDPARRKATVAELQVVNERVADLFTDLTSRIVVVEGAVDVLEGQFAAHDVRINNSDKRIEKIEASAQITIGMLVAGVVIAVIVWILASAIWGSIDHSPAPIVLADGTKITQVSSLNEPFFVFIFGFIWAAIVFAIFLLVARKRAAKEETKTSTESKSDDSPKEQSDADTTPTKPLEATAGAKGARS